MTEFIIEVAEPLMTGAAFPAVVFVVLAAICFATGSFWGMRRVVAPIVFPLARPSEPSDADHGSSGIRRSFRKSCCFYADATLLSSQSAGIDNKEHTITQLPYVVIASVLAIVGFVICGIVM